MFPELTERMLYFHALPQEIFAWLTTQTEVPWDEPNLTQAQLRRLHLAIETEYKLRERRKQKLTKSPV